LELIVIRRVLAVTTALTLNPKVPVPSMNTVDHDEITKLERELDELAELRGRGEISASEWWAIRGPLKQRYEAALSVVQYQAPPSNLDLLKTASDWALADLETMRRVIGRVISRVEVGPAIRGRNTFDPDRVTVHMRSNLDAYATMSELAG
jgi:hypothetical protein